MNDNKKSILEQALDAVHEGCCDEGMSKAEFRRMLNDLRCKLEERDELSARKLPH